MFSAAGGSNWTAAGGNMGRSGQGTAGLEAPLETAGEGTGDAECGQLFGQVGCKWEQGGVVMNGRGLSETSS